MGLEWGDLDPRTWPGQVKSAYEKDFGDSDAEKARKAGLAEQAAAAGDFAAVGERGYRDMSSESRRQRNYLRRLASGEESISAEQLRQGLQRNLSTQMSFAAAGPPSSAAARARQASINAGRAASGMAGNASMAGIAERQSANQALANMILQQRQQDLSAALGSRSNSITGYGGGNQQPEKSGIEKYGPMIAALFAASDERLKKDVKGADDKASTVLKGLRAFTYKYKDERHGKGEQFGIMAQDLERAGLKSAVIDTPDGKMVHGARLAAANTAMLATLGKKIAKLERKGR